MGDPERYALIRGAHSFTNCDLSDDQPTLDELADDAELFAAFAASFSSAVADEELMMF